jgi:hypothetical protein
MERCQDPVEQAPVRYVPPSLEKLRTTLLVKVKKEVVKLITPIKSTCPSSGIIIVYNGWTYLAYHPLINFMLSSKNGLVFSKVKDALGKYRMQHIWFRCPLKSVKN